MSDLDLPRYLERIGFPGPAARDLATFHALHEAHLAAIPFENLDVRLGRTISLDLPSLEAKLVGRRRGGYCFEQNTLFAAVLAALGFRVETLEARVRPPGAAAVLPRTHMVLRVEAEGGWWLADVGFGGDGFVHPVPFEPSGATRAPFALVREPDGVHVLRALAAGTWRDLYAFTLTPALPVDFAVANHFTSTHPSSPFVNTLTVQRTIGGARHVLRGRTYSERSAGREVVRELAADEVAELVVEGFGLDATREEVVRALG